MFESANVTRNLKKADSLSVTRTSLVFTHVYFEWYSNFETFTGILLAFLLEHLC